MRFAILIVGAAFSLSFITAAGARMRAVEVRNGGSKPIYRLYGWPSDLVPRTVNLLSLPLLPGDRKSIQVEDAYDSCIFAFQADYNNPLRTQRPLRTRPRYISLTYKGGVDLCSSKNPRVEFK